MTKASFTAREVAAALNDKITELRDYSVNGKRVNGKPLTSTQRMYIYHQVEALKEIKRTLGIYD